MNIGTLYSMIGGGAAFSVLIIIFVFMSAGSPADQPEIPITPVAEQITANPSNSVNENDGNSTNQFEEEETEIPILPTFLEIEVTIAEELQMSEPSTRMILDPGRSPSGGRDNDDEEEQGNFEYQLQLFEDDEVQESDGLVDLGQKVTAVAITDNHEIDQVTLRWVGPNNNITLTQTIPPLSGEAESTYAPDDLGTWIVEADFGDGIVIQKTLDISFFVVPESPIGLVALLGASFATILGYFYLKRSK